MKAIDPERRARAIELAKHHGVTEAANRTGLDKSTISRWCTSAGISTVGNEQTRNATLAAAQAWETRRQELAHDIGRVAQKALRKAENAVDGEQASDSRAYATTMAILIDKAQLLTGGATTRSEHSEPRQRAKERLDELTERRERSA
jgi:hypothetical protein